MRCSVSISVDREAGRGPPFFRSCVSLASSRLSGRVPKKVFRGDVSASANGDDCMPGLPETPFFDTRPENRDAKLTHDLAFQPGAAMRVSFRGWNTCRMRSISEKFPKSPTCGANSSRV